MFAKILIVVFATCLASGNCKSRIIGGASGDIAKFSYQVSLTYFNYFTESREHTCGGSIISPNVVLTAAHCTSGLPMAMTSTFEVRVGSSSSLSGGELVKVSSIVNHEDYQGYSIINDIAMLILEKSLVFSKTVNKIPIASFKRRTGTVATVSGWGYTTENAGIPSETLNFVALPLIDRETCQVTYFPDEEISDSMMCAGYPEGGKDSCTTDSGGPLVEGGELVGVVSWGFGCGRKNSPGIYTDVFYMRDWIQKNLKKYSV